MVTQHHIMVCDSDMIIILVHYIIFDFLPIHTCINSPLTIDTPQEYDLGLSSDITMTVSLGLLRYHLSGFPI